MFVARVLVCAGLMSAIACAGQSRRLEDGELSYKSGAWLEARKTLYGFVQDKCSEAVMNVASCTKAHMLLGDVEAQLNAFDASVDAYKWVQQSGEPHSERERARTLAVDANNKLTRQLAESNGAVLFIEHDIRQDQRFVIDSDRFLLDGEEILEFVDAVALRSPRARILARPITPGPHKLGVHVKYTGSATHDNYFFQSYSVVEFDVPEHAATRVVLKTEFLKHHNNPLQAIQLRFERRDLSLE
jgi:hypothetical protein